MKIKKAIKILKDHNEWRRDDGDLSISKMTNPKKLGIAIDTVVAVFESKHYTS